MAYKDLQVHVDASTNCSKRLHVAAKMAAELGAHLTGVFVRTPIYLPGYVAPVGGEMLSTLEAHFEKVDSERENEARQLFDRVAAEYDAETLWQSIKGDVSLSLAEESGYADLLVLGQSEPDTDELLTPDSVVLAAGRPCLIVPYIGVQGAVGKHPLIAWNGSRESRRAVHDALPLLEKAETVTIMLSERTLSYDNRDLPDTKIAQHLARHDVKVMTKTLKTKDSHVSNTFLSYIADNDHDLLVMGAYGHSRLREVVFGGVTREMMRTMTVPVLMSH